MGHSLMRPELYTAVRKLGSPIARGLVNFSGPDLAQRFSELGLSIRASESSILTAIILKEFSGYGVRQVPSLVLEVLDELLRGQSGGTVCDPWAAFGELLANVGKFTSASKALAFTQHDHEFALGSVLLGEAEWKLGDPIVSLQSMKGALDLAVSILPFGLKTDRSVTLSRSDGTSVELRDDLANLLLASTAMRLRDDGLAAFVVPPSFFVRKGPVFRELRALGLGLQAALTLPAGTFSPYTNMPTYLVLLRRREIPHMFVGQLTNEQTTNSQVLANLKADKEGGQLELGRFVDPGVFVGLDSIRLTERLAQIGSQFGGRTVRLEELSTAIALGRPEADFKFPAQANAIYIPLIGVSDVVESGEDLTLKPQNYAQVTVDPLRSDARFVARFLNSDLGREIRERSRAGLIPKLNKQSMKGLHVFVPDLPTQKAMLDTEVRIASEQNTLLGLQSELGSIQRELWTNPHAVASANQRLAALSSRLSGGLKQHAEAGLEQWFETLPFPLASICRAWQATPSHDFKTKYEHLLHLFEATAEFLGVVLLSAFSSREEFFAPHRQQITEGLRKQNLSIERASFGTWKLVVEYLGKQTRELLSADKDSKDVCASIFADESLSLPESVSRKEGVAIFATTNKLRNDWRGHGGIVGQDEAKLRNEQLLRELQKLREVFADTWRQTRLLHALHCRPLRGVFENEVEVLKGSNSEFLKETVQMGTWLDVERLYLCNVANHQALKLLPLVQVGPTPRSVKNACYFFSRLERDGSARFISYHFIDEPELKGKFDDAAEAISMLTRP
jgi:hypothetical protein